MQSGSSEANLRNTHNFEAVDDLVYLGSLVRREGSTAHEIK